MKYKLLEKGEKLQKGDEFWDEDIKKWYQIPWYFFKCHYSPLVFNQLEEKPNKSLHWMRHKTGAPVSFAVRFIKKIIIKSMQGASSGCRRGNPAFSDGWTDHTRSRARRRGSVKRRRRITPTLHRDKN